MTAEKDMESRLIADDERIEKYLKGLMEKSDELIFVEELKSNKELRERAVMQARIVRAMKNVDEDIVDAFRHSKIEDLNLRRSKVHQIPLHKWMAIAASILVLFVIGYKSYDYYNVTSLGKEYSKSLPSFTYVRGEIDDETEKEIESVFHKVEIGEDLTSTIALLEKMWLEANMETYNKYTDYAPYIGWNLAIAYLQNYEKDNAVEVLEKLQIDYSEDSFFGEKINNVLRKI